MSRNSRQKQRIAMKINRRINTELLALLESNQLDIFTVRELTTAYIALPHRKQKTVSASRQFISRNVQRLTDKGVLKRLEYEGSHPMYKYTGGADDNLNSMHIPSPSIIKAIPSKQTTGLPDLNEKLYRYNLAMLEAIGEAEEYDDLCSEFPQLHSSLQQRYNDAKDRCSKLLGRVRALEAIMNDHPEDQGL